MASSALPPSRRTARPDCAASACGATTIPRVAQDDWIVMSQPNFARGYTKNCELSEKVRAHLVGCAVFQSGARRTAVEHVISIVNAKTAGAVACGKWRGLRRWVSLRSTHPTVC